MTYDLILGDRAYSSWSLRGWLLFENFGLACKSRFVDFTGSVADQLADLAPARTVPTLRTPEGAIVSDSLAIAEELGVRHPNAGLWPADPRARATARSLAAEMHSGFGPLRQHCPMNLRCAYTGYTPPEDVTADLRRLEAIWDHARATCAPDGPWLCGAYSAADAFFAPVAARIAGYGLQVSDSARAYAAAHLADPAFRRWRAMGQIDGPDLPWYARDHTQTDWPGPKPLPARSVETGPAENATCPYSGKPVTHFLDLNGRVYGFCNAFCRDKTVADPAAWPTFMALTV
jgi:glutathione S-transferase